jgi:hypothetical protein
MALDNAYACHWFLENAQAICRLISLDTGVHHTEVGTSLVRMIADNRLPRASITDRQEYHNAFMAMARQAARADAEKLMAQRLNTRLHYLRQRSAEFKRASSSPSSASPQQSHQHQREPPPAPPPLLSANDDDYEENAVVVPPPPPLSLSLSLSL